MAFCWIYPASGCGFMMVPWLLLAGIPSLSRWFCPPDYCVGLAYCRHIQCVLTLRLILCLFNIYIFNCIYICICQGWCSIYTNLNWLAMHFSYLPATIFLCVRFHLPWLLAVGMWHILIQYGYNIKWYLIVLKVFFIL